VLDKQDRAHQEIFPFGRSSGLLDEDVPERRFWHSQIPARGSGKRLF
jgi:hypothetical protein